MAAVWTRYRDCGRREATGRDRAVVRAEQGRRVRLAEAVGFLLLAVVLFQGSSHAAIVKYTNFAQWQVVAGAHSTIGFDEVPPHTILTTQYNHLGATFLDGNDITYFEPGDFLQDGWGIFGGEGGFFAGVRIDFDEPIHAFSIHHLGTSQFYLYRDGVQIHTETIWFLTGTIGVFSGVTSTEPFDSIRIIDPTDNSIFIDNMYFTPGPGALGIFAIAGLCLGGRRRMR